MTALDLAAVLREHVLFEGRDWICGADDCDWSLPFARTQRQPNAEHQAHVADRLNAAVVEWLESDAVRNVAVTQLLNEGAGVGSSIHSWRCEYPDRYGDCTCVQETAMETLSALAAQIGSVTQ